MRNFAALDLLVRIVHILGVHAHWRTREVALIVVFELLAYGTVFAENGRFFPAAVHTCFVWALAHCSVHVHTTGDAATLPYLQSSHQMGSIIENPTLIAGHLSAH